MRRLKKLTLSDQLRVPVWYKGYDSRRSEVTCSTEYVFQVPSGAKGSCRVCAFLQEAGIRAREKTHAGALARPPKQHAIAKD